MSNNKNNLAITSAVTLSGTALGSCNYYRMKNNFSKELKDIDTDANNKYKDILDNIFSDLKKHEEYKDKIDTFEKENKRFNKDFMVEDILNEDDLAEFNKNKKEFWKRIGQLRDEAIQDFKRNRYLTKNILIGTTLGAVLSGIILLITRGKGNENSTNHK